MIANRVLSLILVCIAFVPCVYAKDGLEKAGKEDLKGPNCSVNYVSAEYKKNQNSIFFWSYADYKLGQKDTPYVTDNFISQIKSTVDHNFNPIITWLERTSSDFRLLSIELDANGQWSEPVVVERSRKELSSTSLLRAASGKVYLSWASDLSGSDDVYLADYADGQWSSPVRVNDANKVPDILPTLSFERDGAVLLRWRTLVSPTIGYEDRFKEISSPLSAVQMNVLKETQCQVDKSTLERPISDEPLFVNYFQDAFDSAEIFQY